MEFLSDDAVTVARKLIGCELYVRESDGSLTGGLITETEAYTAADAASHSYRGKTPRNQVMFDAAGAVYVYFTYGMHWCMNIVTGDEGVGEAVLIRSIDPAKNIEIMRQRRNYVYDSQLTNGPAKICQALGVTGTDNGMIVNDSRFILLPANFGIGNVVATERIGIKRDTHRLWRFVLEKK